MNDASKKQKFVILYKYVSYKAFESIMEKWALKATFPFESNDPLEYVAQYTDSKIDGHINNHTPQDEPPPFISFSRKMSDVTMWGQYADFARGVCLVFKFPLSKYSREYWPDESADSIPTYIHHSAKDDTRDIRLEGVRYSNERFTPGDLNKEQPDYETLIMALNWKIFSQPIKAESWQYENEVRIMEKCEHASSESNGMLLYSWPLNYLYGVIVGSNTPFPTEYIKQKIRICYNNKGKNHYFWKDSFDCHVIRASIHPTKFAYEAYPFGDRIENDLLEKVMNLTNHHYDASKTWHDLSKKMLHELAEWRNRKIQDISKKVVRLLQKNNSVIEEDDVKSCFQYIRCIMSHSIIREKVFKGEPLIAENIQEAITSNPKEKENWKHYATILLQCGFESIVKEIYFEAESTIDTIVAKYFKESK